MDKLTGILKKNLIALLLSAGVLCWTFVKDLISTGADVKFNDKIVLIIKGEKATKYIDSLILEAIDREMNNPMSLIEVLSSDHVNAFAESKAVEVREAVKRELLKSDSIKGDIIHDLGEGTGMRNEDILPELIELLKAFKSGKLYSSRTVRAAF